jgi:hypothetical protein
MTLPLDIADRLRAIDHAPERYVDMVQQRGAEFVRRYVERLEDADRLYQEWAPRLREFAAACREKSACPEVCALNDRDRAKLPVYESLITKAGQHPRYGRKEVLLCSIPLVGIPVAMMLWPGNDDRSVFLTPDEISEWDGIYKHPEESFWWFTNYWWHIEDPPKPNSLWTRNSEPKTPDGTDPWLVVSGLSWGTLAGSERADLWSWNGREALFVRELGCCDF